MSTIAPENAPGLAPEIHERRARAKAWFEALQQRICAELERLEDEAPAELYPEAASRFDFPPGTPSKTAEVGPFWARFGSTLADRRSAAPMRSSIISTAIRTASSHGPSWP